MTTTTDRLSRLRAKADLYSARADAYTAQQAQLRAENQHVRAARLQTSIDSMRREASKYAGMAIAERMKSGVPTDGEG